MKFENKEYYKTQFTEDYLRRYHGLTRSNKHFRCMLPAHEDTGPSMKYYSDSNKCFCFGCGRSIDLYDIVGIDYGLDWFPERYAKVEELYGGRI